MALADMGLLAFTPALVLAAFAWVWLREFDHAKDGPLVAAGGYGLALAAVAIAVMHGELSIAWILDHPSPRLAESPAPGSAPGLRPRRCCGRCAIACARRCAARIRPGQDRVRRRGHLAVATLKAPGIGPAAAVLVIGFANGNRVLAGLGLLALLGYLSHYYYAMQLTLLEKSAVLACTGVALLAVRLALLRYWPATKEEASHA
jgi:hypothetical protein